MYVCRRSWNVRPAKPHAKIDVFPDWTLGMHRTCAIAKPHPLGSEFAALFLAVVAALMEEDIPHRVFRSHQVARGAYLRLMGRRSTDGAHRVKCPPSSCSAREADDSALGCDDK
mmetsp:Transcript_58244/g.189859  ORF Transcript_58244/g.189859 Transcript_58244/m.189859 type:complete len:114 (+) Transcript_58244:1-342(+)|eukprot:CAMPEP_0203967002 /NCGR_PEP_ID=MMETSP0359-20131031/96093_1 /ASSEMBLY_ACC=CAM_ASM_000338 /TAXON_ID=268821 /ORGANISM="Scrippsiella Hangoei, Strain SHTV-5" /LENGTH=113 /DNA_ID=CAMNT_0050904655 /DNA_START=1 /DNA_END=342 /DNA_ORIENTATION=+